MTHTVVIGRGTTQGTGITGKIGKASSGATLIAAGGTASTTPAPTTSTATA
jgi:hypothetical protein